MKDSKDYYDSIAAKYEKISFYRTEYNNGINQQIYGYCKSDVYNNYLDIGAGDGKRSMKIAQKLKVNNIYLLDDSELLLSRVARKERVMKVNESILRYSPGIQFDLITCLWNVLGHIKKPLERESFFYKIEKILSKDGVFVIDVNNRYNISQYGNKNVMTNLYKDLSNDSTAGVFLLEEGKHKTHVYIHAPFEIENYCKMANLSVEKVMFIDYGTGKVKETCFEGQLLYFIKKT